MLDIIDGLYAEFVWMKESDTRHFEDRDKCENMFKNAEVRLQQAIDDACVTLNGELGQKIKLTRYEQKVWKRSEQESSNSKSKFSSEVQ